MPTSRMTKAQTLQQLQAYAARATHFTPDECERIADRFEYTPRQEPEEMP